jgi:hypothetical protein
VSSSAGDAHGGGPNEALLELEHAVEAAARRLRDLTARVEAAEERSRHLEELIGRFTGNAEEAGRLLDRLGTLDDENVDLKARLEAGRAGVDRILARIRFLEDQR